MRTKTLKEDLYEIIEVYTSLLCNEYIEMGKIIDIDEKTMLRYVTIDCEDIMLKTIIVDGNLHQNEVDIINSISGNTATIEETYNYLNSPRYINNVRDDFIPFLLLKAMEHNNTALYSYRPSYLLYFDIIITCLILIDGVITPKEMQFRDELFLALYNTAVKIGLPRIEEIENFNKDDLIKNNKSILMSIAGTSVLWDFLCYKRYKDIYDASEDDTVIKSDESKTISGGALGELSTMIGLNEVKDRVNSIINLVKVRQLRSTHGLKNQDMSLHMVFTGNPGTGKTTVARHIASIYKEMTYACRNA